MSIYVWTSEIKNIYVWTTPVKEVYVWTTKVRPSGWTPTSNTVVYYPLTTSTTTTDQSWNGKNLTKNGTVTFGTYQWVNCAYFNWSYLYNTNITTLPQWNSARTVSFYVYCTWTDKCIFTWWNTSSDHVIGWFINNQGRFNDTTYYWSSFYWNTNVRNAWHNIMLISDGSTKRIYVDGVLDGSNSSTYNTSWYPLYIGYLSWANYNFVWYLWDFLIENIAWNATKVLDYYNLTKGKYWK